MLCALYSFCIKMPFLHRLACFRDDVVFLVFLYQVWLLSCIFSGMAANRLACFVAMDISN
jgi:hypothetical protein